MMHWRFPAHQNGEFSTDLSETIGWKVTIALKYPTGKAAHLQ